MNLESTYLGLRLKHPIMPGASPMGASLDSVKRLEDAGAPAIVMHSLFEEQGQEFRNGSRNPAAGNFPGSDDYAMEPEEYFDRVRTLKSTVGIPVIASINGTKPGAWVDFARSAEQAGADALELNLYRVPTDPSESSFDVESESIEVVRAVRESVTMPVAVKLSPYYSSLAYFARELAVLGANGLVLFNRFYQPDINPDTLEHSSRLELSDSSELRLRLRWIGILRGHVGCSLACTGGVHRSLDAVKALMAGADAIQCVSSLLHFGPRHLETLVDGLKHWMETHGYDSVSQIQGRMSLRNCRDISAYERANYLNILNTWKV